MNSREKTTHTVPPPYTLISPSPGLFVDGEIESIVKSIVEAESEGNETVRLAPAFGRAGTETEVELASLNERVPPVI